MKDVLDALKAEHVKHDGEGTASPKPAFDLLPPEFLFALAQLCADGAAEYAPRNWEKGARWGRYFAAAMRHAWAWWGGEKNDPKSKASHLVAAAWNLMALYVYETRGLGKDDRRE